MTSVLLVDDDDMLRRDVAQVLQTNGYDVHEATNVETAVVLLRDCQPDILLTDLRLDGRDGIDLLSEMRSISPRTLAVLMSGFASAKDYQTATDLGAVKVLTKPFTPRAVIDAMQHAVDCGTGFRGSVHGLSLVDMLQMFHFGQRTITLEVGAAGGGWVEFLAGEIVHAQVNDQVGAAALRAILSMPSGAMRTRVPSGEIHRTIDIPFQSLLMDSLREVDEQRRASLRPGAADDFELAFTFASSLPPDAPGSPALDPRYLALVSLLERTAPQFGLGVVRPGRGEVFPLRNFTDTGASAWPGLISQARTDLASMLIDQSCLQLEYVGEKIAFALIFMAQQDDVLVVDAAMVDQLAPQRFRSQVRQVLSYLGST